MTKVYAFVGNELSPLELMSKFKQDRNLDDTQIDLLGIRLVPSIESKGELGWIEPNPLIRIPYFGITGEKLADNRGNQLCRYRRTVLNAKGERYTQRAGTGARHYLPPGADWLNIARDPSIPIFYTEGEFKAITASKHLGPTVANAGVTSWRGLGSKLAAPLDEFQWRGRQVYIVYDAEATSTAAVPLKSNIARSLGELALDLQVRGATVMSLLIAKTSFFVEGTKMGVDDYFHAGGTRDELLATAMLPVVDAEWARMFERYAVHVGTHPHIKNLLSGDVYSGKEFADYIEIGLRMVEKKPTKIANIYREHEDRNWFDQYVFDPQLASGFLRDDHKFNTWPGFEIQAARSESYEDHVNSYIHFQTGVWGESYVQYFLDWAAHLFQRPWELTTISPILVSRVKGVGKSLTGGILRDLIGTKGAFVGSVDGLTEKHTGELEGKILVQVDEADALFEGKEERLKALDSDEIRIRKMNTDGYTIKNILRKFYTTNKNAAWRISENERRYFVVRVAKTEEDGLEESEWSQFLRGKIVPMRRDKVALADLMYFFMNRDISSWDPGAPVPRTEAMMDMVEAGESKKDTMAHELYADLASFGVWVTDSAMTAVDKKLWGEVRGILKDKGGRTAQHQMKVDGSVKSVTVWMVKDRLLNIKEDVKKGSTLVAGQIGGDDVRSLLLKTRTSLETVMRLVDSTKF